MAMNEMKPFLLLLAVSGLAAGASAQSQTTKVISVTDPRPVSAAMLKLEEASNQPMTFEEPPVVYVGDIVDRSDSYPHKPGVKVLMPRFVTLSVGYEQTEIANRAGTATVLQRLVDTFNTENPTRPQFAVLDKDGLFHVIPRTQRLASGRRVPYTSPLDVPLSVTVKDVSASDAFNAILNAIEAQTGTKILIGWSPFGMGLSAGDRRRVSISAHTDTGRTLLTQLIKDFSPWCSWELLTGANVTGEPTSFYISIQQWVHKPQ